MKYSAVKQYQSDDALSERVLGQNNTQMQKEETEFHECMQFWKTPQNTTIISREIE